jgi:hypothetical protein
LSLTYDIATLDIVVEFVPLGTFPDEPIINLALQGI